MSADANERELLRDTVARLLASHCTPERVAAAAKASAGWDAPLWQALEDTGLTLVGSPEELGGSGGDLASAAEVAVAAGAVAAPVPIGETLAAGMLLARAGRRIPPGPLTLAVAAGGGETLRRVPYGRLATTVAVGGGPGGEWLAVAARGSVARFGRNVAGEPRDDLRLSADAEIHPASAGTVDHARWLLRLFRALLISGAARRALELTVAYVTEREQFGRPLGKMPAVQQEIARMAGEVALIGAAAQAAVADGAVADDVSAVADGVVADDVPAVADADASSARDAISAVLAAKAQASHGAGIVAAIAHQMHGAIGTTEEHRLRLTTTRLWSWREEDGTASECFAELGRAALQARAGGLWPWLTGGSGA